MATHVQDECLHRPAACPYQSLGCVVQLRCKDLGEHMQQCAFMHLALVWSETQKRTDEIRAQTDSIASKIGAGRDSLSDQISALKAQLAATAGMAAAVQKEMLEMKAEVKKLQSITHTQTSNIDDKVAFKDWKSVCSEMNALRNDLKNTRIQVEQLKKMKQELE
mmetsp:Transcript_47115/g.89969  ORF Transcript_47115/g.89969 Transcript_47115/m.89969 type:complete len:164 (-) Transcript_47115:561-1052(-)